MGHNTASSRLGDRSWICASHTPSRWVQVPQPDGTIALYHHHRGALIATVEAEADARVIVLTPELVAIVASMYARMTTGAFSRVEFEDKARSIEMLRDVLTDAGFDVPVYDKPGLPIQGQGDLFEAGAR